MEGAKEGDVPGGESSMHEDTGLMSIKGRNSALAGVAQWIECRPVNQRVAGSIPSWGTGLGCGPGPQ